MTPAYFIPRKLALVIITTLFCAFPAITAQAQRAMHFQAASPAEALTWQKAARAKLVSLMMGGAQPARCPLDPKVVRHVEVSQANYFLEELTIQSLPDRRAHLWVARPVQPRGKVGAVLAINGHGGSGEEVIHGTSLYWYGRKMAEMGYVVVAPDVGQHKLQHTNWSIMGERTWDALLSLDYVLTLPEVDSERLAVAGLSLGGETTMYVAALDERLKLACSSGWLTTVANMKNGHCLCFNFAGLEDNFDFSDIFSCVAPRILICELGELERAPGGFPVTIGRQALDQIRTAYRIFQAESNLTLTVHPGPHVFSGQDFLPKLRATLGENCRPLPDDAATDAWVRFDDAPEALDGTPYWWLGRGNLRLSFDIRPQPGDALELSWGAKSDHRDAMLVINGQKVAVQDGGHWGFRWIRVPVPDSIKGDRYEVEIQRGKAQPAFLSEVRHTSTNNPVRQFTSGKRPTTFNATIRATPAPPP